MKWEKERYLVCAKGEDIIPITGEERVIICFTVNAEKYFIQSKINPAGDGKWWRIDGFSDLFKLQRRQAFRIRIPLAYKTKATIKDLNDKVVCTGVIVDISSGGCKVIVDGSSKLQGGEIQNIELIIGRRDSISVSGEIRHVRKIESPKIQDQLGVMFKSVSSILESKLFAITMELHRELAGKVGT
jgi:c-di-GMP-binding flagellar brake protein YcgR